MFCLLVIATGSGFGLGMANGGSGFLDCLLLDE